MPLPLLQHVQLLPQIQYGFLGRISPPLGGLPAKPVAPHRWRSWVLQEAQWPPDMAFLLAGVEGVLSDILRTSEMVGSCLIAERLLGEERGDDEAAGRKAG